MTLERLLMPIEAILQEQCKNETEDHEIVQDHMQSIKQTIAGSQHYIKWYQSSTESQVQTIYQITNQIDNGINAEIASRAAEDSTNMRVIAITLFSTSFFNFQPPYNPRVVSWWIWLYWTVTVALTVIVLGVWRYLYQSKGTFLSEDMVAFHNRREQRKQRPDHAAIEDKQATVTVRKQSPSFRSHSPGIQMV
ncbi:hypothetical protein H2201_008510 [Coniosporium apollinis]|uniref:Plasma membrane fusion protein PRM1 n=2 Tax=Coniosporium TaxID=2810619 RepID=A0ABQ9NIU6_9PEZI|nr:hypothetical protein H2199_004319 [Cladosporium sp. JES 115]KAJ9656577.1 hypothetical protein H2201_008510 [Coniosporium apollinis]